MKMKRTGKIVLTLVTALLLVLTAACAPVPEEVTPTSTPEEVTPPTPIAPAGMGIIKVYVTDPPRPELTSIEVFIDSIKVHQVSDNASEWIDVPVIVSSFDLVKLFGVAEFLVCPVAFVDRALNDPQAETPGHHKPEESNAGMQKEGCHMECRRGDPGGTILLRSGFVGTPDAARCFEGGRGTIHYVQICRKHRAVPVDPRTGGDVQRFDPALGRGGR